MILHDKPSIFYSPCSVSHGSARRPCRPRRSSLTHRSQQNQTRIHEGRSPLPHTSPTLPPQQQDGPALAFSQLARRRASPSRHRSGHAAPTSMSFAEADRTDRPAVQGRGMHCASLAGAQGRGRTTLGGVHTADRAASPPRPFPRPAGSEKLDVSSREYKLRVYCQENRRLGKTIGEARG